MSAEHSVVCGMGTCHATEAKASQKAFDKLKALHGEWDGYSQDGAKQLHLKYMVASNSSIVIEFYRHIFKGKEVDDEMVTVYHPNGDELMLTHYCTLGNQPKMVADLTSGEDRILSFSYVNATNLTHNECLRMSGVRFEFLESDRFKQTWYWCGKKKYVDPNHHSDDYDDLPDDGLGEDTFTLIRRTT